MWPGARARILAAPTLGADLVQYRIDLDVEQGTRYAPDGRTEWFLFLRAGRLNVTINGGRLNVLEAGAFLYLPHTAHWTFLATEPATLLLLRRVYWALEHVRPPAPILSSDAAVEPRPYGDDPAVRVQPLLPDDLTFDLRADLVTIDAAAGLPDIQTPTAELAAWVLDGRGAAWLEDRWLDVQADDFLWAGPFVPQAFRAAEDASLRLLCCRSVNRDVVL